MIELRTNLDVNLGLILTPKLDLSLKVLTMNIAQIEQQLNEIVQSNPLAKIDEDVKVAKSNPEDKKFKEIDDYFKEYFNPDIDSTSDIIESTVSKEDSLHTSLLKQLAVEIDLDEVDLEIAKNIIYNIDEKGFLEVPPENIAKQLNVELQRVELLRKKITRLEPIGIGCLGVKEFLLVQAEEENKNIDILKTFIKAIDDVNKPNMEKIRKNSGLSEDDFKKALEIVTDFMIYPLENYQRIQQIDYIKPDIVIRKIGSDLIALVEDRNISKLSIDEQLLNEYLKDDDARKFTEEKYRELKEFMLAISNRNKTLLKTVNIILKKQKQFFEDGTIKPLTRKDIAEILGFNVSTITRAVSNKYVLFEGKIIPLSKFFSSGVSKGISKDYVKSIIEDIVKKENKDNPLSDDQIKDKLDEMSIHLTRRTITKYRKELGIPSSRERKCQNTQ